MNSNMNPNFNSMNRNMNGNFSVEMNGNMGGMNTNMGGVNMEMTNRPFGMGGPSF